MRVTMIGTGYVGLVSGACFADFGHDVICVDKDESKINRLNKGEIPIFEPGLEKLVAQNVEAGRLSFTTDTASAVADADAVFIAVGTPSRRGDGHADLTYVYARKPDKIDSILFDDRSNFEALDCVVYSNSTRAQALHTTNRASASASRFLARGHVLGSGFTPSAEAGAVAIQEPRYTVPRNRGTCITGIRYNSGTHIMAPGRYCDGVEITGNADVTLAPGVFIFDDGPLNIGGSAQVQGHGVTLHFSGFPGAFNWGGNATINLTAPKVGPYAGLVLTENTGIGHEQSFIDGNAEVRLVGAAYINDHHLTIGGRARVGVDTQYIALIVERLTVTGNAEVTLEAKPALLGYPDRLPRASYLPRLVR
jgi:hypothetical protein